jgi:hypothetical protein
MSEKVPMGKILFHAIPSDSAHNWRQFRRIATRQIAPTEHVERLGDNVWMIDEEDQLTMGKLFLLARRQGISCRTRRVDHASEWTDYLSVI